VHCHIGSQIFGSDAHVEATDRLLAFMAEYRDVYKTELPELDLGGGFGIAYVEGDTTVEPSDVLPAIRAAVVAACKKYKLDIPTVSFEPGRNIVGPTMFTLYEVGTVKDVVIEGGVVRKYVSVDGGMSDNPRPVLYGSGYEAFLPRAVDADRDHTVRLVGKHCESGDVLAFAARVPSDLAVGDLLATPVTGAYGHSMGSNYNKVTRPPVVFVANGEARLVVRRETYADLLAADVLGQTLPPPKPPHPLPAQHRPD